MALSLGSPRAGVTRRHLSLESGLSSVPAAAAVRPSARARLGSRSRAPRQRIASQRQRRGDVRGLRIRPPRAQGRKRRRNGVEHRDRSRPRAPHSPPPPRPRGRHPSRRSASRRVGPDRAPADAPAAASRTSAPDRPCARAPCRNGAMTPGGRDRPARRDRVEQRLERRHLRLGERRKAVERPGVGELDPDRARVDVVRAAPAARRPRARRAPPRPPAARPGRPRRSGSAPRPPPPGREAAPAPPRRVRIAVWCSTTSSGRRPSRRSPKLGLGASTISMASRLGDRRCDPRRCGTAPRPTAACTPCRSAGSSWATAAAACTATDCSLGDSRWRSRAWICCLTEFRGRRPRGHGATATPRSSSSTKRPRSPPATGPASSAGAPTRAPSQRPGRRGRPAGAAARRRDGPRAARRAARPAGDRRLRRAARRRDLRPCGRLPAATRAGGARLELRRLRAGTAASPRGTRRGASRRAHVRAALAAGYRPALHPSAPAMVS